MKQNLKKRTREFLLEAGWSVDNAEHFNAYSMKSSDLFGFADLVAMLPPMCVAVQATDIDNRMRHYDKILSIPKAKTWLLCGNHIWLIAWGRRTKQGKVLRGTWYASLYMFGLEDFSENKDRHQIVWQDLKETPWIAPHAV